MNDYIEHINYLWTDYLRKATEEHKLKLLLDGNEEVVDFLLNCELSHSESYGKENSGSKYDLIYLKRKDDTLVYRKEYFANYPSKAEMNFVSDLTVEALEKIGDYLVAWFEEIKLYYYKEHFYALQTHPEYLMTFLNATEWNITDIHYTQMHKNNEYHISGQDMSYLVIHKDHIDLLAKNNMRMRLYGELFSKRRISLRALATLSGIKTAEIKEMYQLGKGETLNQDQADEFIYNHVDMDAYYQNEFDNYGGYVGLMGNKKYPEIISGDFYIIRYK